MNAPLRLLVLVGLMALSSPALAELPAAPEARAAAGMFLVGGDHDFFVESEVRIPLLSTNGWGIAYRHYEATPFLGLAKGERAEVLHQQDEVWFGAPLPWSMQLLAVAGYQVSHVEDRTGRSRAYALGGGLGSVAQDPLPRLAWQALAGGFVDQSNLAEDWWASVQARWRALRFGPDRYLDGEFQHALALAGRLELTADGDQLHPLAIVGPEWELTTANGNRAALRLAWYLNDGQPFYGSDENGLLLSFEVSTGRDRRPDWNARESRTVGWLPLLWGIYEAGTGTSHWSSRLELTAEVVDVRLGDRLLTAVVWYETHQDHRVGAFDNISYSVSAGVQTPVGWESPLSQGEPLVLGVDFLHRSDHTLNADPDIVAAEGRPSEVGLLIPNGALNLLPRLRLQTLGWELPYRDPAIYAPATRWLHRFDWRLTAGYDLSSTRHRFPVAAQAGLNWDVATCRGYVPYLKGVISTGNETPDWSLETGVRRPAGRLFVRWEEYGLNPALSRGDMLLAGIGINL